MVQSPYCLCLTPQVMTQVPAVKLADKSRMLAGFGFRTHKRPRKQVCVFSLASVHLWNTQVPPQVSVVPSLK